MTEPEKCPDCGAVVCVDTRSYCRTGCGRVGLKYPGQAEPTWGRATPECYQRQLAATKAALVETQDNYQTALDACLHENGLRKKAEAKVERMRGLLRPLAGLYSPFMAGCCYEHEVHIKASWTVAGEEQGLLTTYAVGELRAAAEAAKGDGA